MTNETPLSDDHNDSDTPENRAEATIIDVSNTTTNDASENNNGDSNQSDGSDSRTTTDPEETIERGKSEARRHIEQAEGETISECVDNALTTLREKFQNIAQKHQQASSKVQEHEANISNLQDTIDHLQTLNKQEDPPLVLRQWAGGIQTAVDGDLTETISDLEERVSQLKGQHTQLEEQAEKLRRGRETLKAAVYVASQTKETLPNQNATLVDTNSVPEGEADNELELDDLGL